MPSTLGDMSRIWKAMLRVGAYSLFLVALLGAAGGLVTQPAHADVEDFQYRSWDVDMDVVLDADGRAHAHITETLVAVFPEYDQNRGIIRALPTTYENAPATPTNVSVTDEQGEPSPFFTEEEDGFFGILTGTNEYVHGEQTYVISYKIPDVIFQPDNDNIDELYWDLVSVQRAQSIDSFTATVTVDESLTQAATGNYACYMGRAGSTDVCSGLDVSGSTYRVGPLSLGADETVTLAVGFTAGTVTQPQQRIPNPLLDVASGIAGAIGAAAVAVGGVMVSRLKKRRSSTGRAIIAQYEVPSNLPPLLATRLITGSSNTVVAQFLHLAVRGFMRVEEQTKKDGTLHKKPRPLFRRLYEGDPATGLNELYPGAYIDQLDIDTLQSLFIDSSKDTFVIPKKSEKFSKRMTSLEAKGEKAAKERGYVTKVSSAAARWCGVVAVLIGSIATALSIVGINAERSSPGPVIGIALGIASVVGGLVLFGKYRVHTQQGAEYRELLLGVKEFISVAEQDRLQMLQSFKGAERVELDTVQVLRLYERLLPYAVLFGLEKQWGKVLAYQYTQTNVSTVYWYPYLGTRGFSQLAPTMSALTSQITESASYTSSSSSGSGGGGFAGGGGGGGMSGGR